MRMLSLTLSVLLGASGAVAAQQLHFEDVVRNLRHPDPKVRLSAVQLLREADYPEAVAPLAPLVADPLDDIQLETIATELSFFVTEPVQIRRRVGFFIERRRTTFAEPLFDLGPTIRVSRPVPSELISSLLTAVDDETPRVRLEAMYTLGAIAPTSLSDEQSTALIKALDHYDPEIRAAAARVIGRLKVTAAGDSLLEAVNDSHPEVRYAAMLALGSIHDERAVSALSDQLRYYGKGEGAWSALQGLAMLGDLSSVPLFKARLADKDPFMRRAAAEGLGRAGDRDSIVQLRETAVSDSSPMVRAAMAFALQKLGENYVTRLADSMAHADVASQVQAYLIELGTPVAPGLYPSLLEPDPFVRESVAGVLGVIGDDAAVAPLEAASKDKDGSVAAAAKRALEKIQTRRG